MPHECHELGNDDDLHVPAFVIPGTRKNQVEKSRSMIPPQMEVEILEPKIPRTTSNLSCHEWSP
jgi:hypothetical protein